MAKKHEPIVNFAIGKPVDRSQIEFHRRDRTDDKYGAICEAVKKLEPNQALPVFIIDEAQGKRLRASLRVIMRHRGIEGVVTAIGKYELGQYDTTACLYIARNPTAEKRRTGKKVEQETH